MKSDDERWHRQTAEVERPATSASTVRGIPQPGVGTGSPSGSAAQARYEETGELGRGGMGRVFEARDHLLDRTVAIKQSLTDDFTALARFEREAKITAQLQHPGIVPVLDAGRDSQGRPFYIMRKIEGQPLADVIAATSTMAERIALIPRVLAAVEAVAYAHARGIIHRDIKSWNVLLGPFGETLVIDWGIARELAEVDVPTTTPTRVPARPELTQLGQAVGTPGFMPPEQARGEPVDRRADVYSLGAMLYHVLAGKHPVEGAERGLPDTTNDAPSELVAILGKAMATARDDRYPDAGALAEDLRRFTTGKLVAAHHYTARELLGRWLRRHRIAVAVAMVAMLVVGVLATLAVRRVLSERDRADIAATAEAARADDGIVERADAIVNDDPTQAIALLAQLPDDSAAWRRAAGVYDSARVRGVARGRVAHQGATWTQVFAADDGSSVVSLADDGQVLLHDPELRTVRSIAVVPGAFEMDSIDTRSFVVRTGTGLVLVRIDGSMRTLDASGPIEKLEVQLGRVFVVDRQGRVREVNVDGSGSRVWPWSKEFLAVPEGAIYVVDGRVVYQRDNGPAEELAFEPTRTVARIVRSNSGRRIAVGFINGPVFEWTLAEKPIPSGRWLVADTTNLSYVGERLLHLSRHGQAWLPPNAPPHQIAQVRFASVAATRDDCAALTTSNELYLLCGDVIVHVGGTLDDARWVVVLADHVIAATMFGTLRAWKRSDVMPLRVPAPVGRRTFSASVFGLGQVFLATDTLTAVSVANGAATELGSAIPVCLRARRGVLRTAPSRFGPVPIELVPEGARQLELIDATLQRTTLAEGLEGFQCDVYSDQIGLLEHGELVIRDLAQLSARPIKIAIDPAVVVFTLAQRWVAILGPTWVERIDLATGLRARLDVADGRNVVVDPTGRVAVLKAKVVVIWDGRTVTEVSTPDAVTLASRAGLFVVMGRAVTLVIDAAGSVRTFTATPGYLTSLAVDRPLLTMPLSDSSFQVLDLRDGSRRRFIGSGKPVLINPEGTQVLASRSTHALIWDISKLEPDELRRRVRAMTNGFVRPGSNRVEFP